MKFAIHRTCCRELWLGGRAGGCCLNAVRRLRNMVVDGALLRDAITKTEHLFSFHYLETSSGLN